MTDKHLKIGRAGIAITLLALGAPGLSAGQSHNVVDLGTLGGPEARALGISDQGQVVGYADTATRGQYHAFRWEAGVMSDLDPDRNPWNGSQAGRINSRGDAVGHVYRDNNSRTAVWRGGRLMVMGTLGGRNSQGYGINAAGDVVGGSDTAAGRYHAVLWNAAGEMTDLGPGRAWDITTTGEIVGVTTADGSYHASLWAGGKMTDLGTLGGRDSEAPAVNDSFEVVGWAHTDIGRANAFRWTPEEGMVSLGTLGGGSSGAMDINGYGQVVGWSFTPDFSSHAFLWTKGKMYDLNDLIPPDSRWVLLDARGINAQGQIVGVGEYGGDPRRRGYLLNPIGVQNPRAESIP